MATCVKSGPWSNITGTPFISKQEFQSTFIFILCQTLNAAKGLPIMGNCATVAGAWDSVRGNPYLSDQEFYANALSLLCDLANSVTSGTGTGYLIVLNTQADLPAAPSDPTKVWFASFRDGSAGKVWDPNAVPLPKWI